MFVLIAWSWGGQSFTFISEPPFVGTEIRREREALWRKREKDFLVQN